MATLHYKPHGLMNEGNGLWNTIIDMSFGIQKRSPPLFLGLQLKFEPFIWVALLASLLEGAVSFNERWFSCFYKSQLLVGVSRVRELQPIKISFPKGELAADQNLHTSLMNSNTYMILGSILSI